MAADGYVRGGGGVITVFMVHNKINNKKFIGSSLTHLIELRINRMFNSMRRNTFKNENYALQQDFNQYGEDSFEIIILGNCNKEDVIKIKDYYINLYDTQKGYNCFSADRKTKINDSSRLRIAFKQKEYNQKPEVRKERSEKQKLLYKNHPELIKRMSISKLGNKYCLGYKHTEEAKKKMSQCKKGKYIPWNKGIPHTEETKVKMRKPHRKERTDE